MKCIKVFCLFTLLCCCSLLPGQSKEIDVAIEYLFDPKIGSIPIKIGKNVGDVFYDENSVQSYYCKNGVYHYKMEQGYQYIGIPIDINGSYLKVFFGDYKCTELHVRIMSALVENYLTDTIIETESTFLIRTDKVTHDDTIYYKNSKTRIHINEGIQLKDDFQVKINDADFILKLNEIEYTEKEILKKYKMNILRKLFNRRKYINTLLTKNQRVYYSEFYL